MQEIEQRGIDITHFISERITQEMIDLRESTRLIGVSCPVLNKQFIMPKGVS